MKTFILNGYIWHVERVPPISEELTDRTGKRTVGTTDPVTQCIYLAEGLVGKYEKRVLAHELGHATCFSYGLIDEIHRMCYPEHWIRMEEFICNFVADYGERIFELTYEIAGDAAMDQVQRHLEKLIS